MIPTLAPTPGQPALMSDQIAEMVEKSAQQWVDQYNQHLLLTVQALQRLHLAFDRKFTG